MSRINDCRKKASERIIELDIYGQPISLYYQGKPTYQTHMGGLFTVITALIVLIYLLTKGVAVVTQEYEINQKVTQLNEYSDDTIYSLDSTRVDFMYELEYEYPNDTEVRENPDRYFYFDFYQLNETYGMDQITRIAQEPCSSHTFQDDDYFPKELEIKERYTCFDLSNFQVQGTYGSEKMIMYKMILHTCSEASISTNPNYDSCEDPEKIKHVIQNSNLKFVFLQEVFEEGTFGTIPIKRHPKVHYFNYKLDLSIVQEVVVNKNHLVLKDHWLHDSIGSETIDFYDTKLTEVKIGTIVDRFGMFELRFRKGFNEETIERRTANLMDAAADLGGFLSIVQLVIAYLLGSYVEKQYFNSVLQQLFKHQRDLISKKKKEKMELKSNAFEGTKSYFHSRLLSSLINRKPASMNPFPQYTKRIINLFKKKKPNKGVKTNARKEFYKAQVEEKIMNEFSIERVIKRARKVKILSALILTKEQRTLLPYTFNNLILSNPQTRDYQSVIKKHLTERSGESLNSRIQEAFAKKYSIAGMIQSREDIEQEQFAKLSHEERLSKSLEALITRLNEDKLNQSLLKQLINCEESDFLEQLILYGDVRKGSQDQNANPFLSYLQRSLEKGVEPVVDPKNDQPSFLQSYLMKGFSSMLDKNPQQEGENRQEHTAEDFGDSQINERKEVQEERIPHDLGTKIGETFDQLNQFSNKKSPSKSERGLLEKK